MKCYLQFIISLCLLALTITPVYSAYATLPNQAVFNWVEYKFADLFPKAQTVKSELTHDGVHYELRSWSGAWGTRYLGITDDGEIVGLGDFTDGVLLSFGYVSEWEDAVIADSEPMFMAQTVNLSYVVSDAPTTSFGFYDEAIADPYTSHDITDMNGNDIIHVFPSYFRHGPALPGLEFIETSPGSDRYELQRELPNVALGFVRNMTEMDTNNPNFKRFAMVDQGLELGNDYPGADTDYAFGDVWVATDYGSGFEFKKITNVKGFYHGITAYDMDNNGWDDIVAVCFDTYIENMFYGETLNTFSQDTEGNFRGYHALEPRPNWDNYDLTASVHSADLDNDGVDELIQSSYAIGGDQELDWGSIRIWTVNDAQKYEQATIIPREGLMAELDFGYADTDTIDYNNDGLLDIIIFAENTNATAGNGIEIYKNLGNLQFTRVTEELFPDRSYYFHRTGQAGNYENFVLREFRIADVNNDGLEDIILATAGVWNNEVTGFDPYWTWDEKWAWRQDIEANGFPYNLGTYIFLNTGDKFVRQDDNPTYTIRLQGITEMEQLPRAVKFKTAENGVLKFMGFMNDTGAPIIITVDSL